VARGAGSREGRCLCVLWRRDVRHACRQTAQANLFMENRIPARGLGAPGVDGTRRPQSILRLWYMRASFRPL